MANYEDILAEAKSYLQIDWDTDDLALLSIIKRGERRLNHIAGSELTYEEASEERALLLDYVRYARSQALEVFEKNFSSELLELHYTTQLHQIGQDQVTPQESPSTQSSEVAE